MEIEVGKLPSKILAFDPAKKVEPMPVDLEQPFFKIARPDYTQCDHKNRGVTLNMSTRRAECLCGVEIDAFDALLIYAHAQQRLIHHAEAIKEHARKEAEKKAKRPFVKRVTGLAARFVGKRRRLSGYDVRLECGHEAFWDKRRPPRAMTCDRCFREAELNARGVASVPTAQEALHV